MAIQLSEVPVESAELRHSRLLAFFSEMLRSLGRYVNLFYSKRYRPNYVSLENY